MEAAARPAQQLTPDCSTAGDCPERLQRETLGPMESQFQSSVCREEEGKGTVFPYIVLSVPVIEAQNSSHCVQCWEGIHKRH